MKTVDSEEREKRAYAKSECQLGRERQIGYSILVALSLMQGCIRAGRRLPTCCINLLPGIQIKGYVCWRGGLERPRILVSHKPAIQLRLSIIVEG